MLGGASSVHACALPTQILKRLACIVGRAATTLVARLAAARVVQGKYSPFGQVTPMHASVFLHVGLPFSSWCMQSHYRTGGGHAVGVTWSLHVHALGCSLCRRGAVSPALYTVQPW